MTRALGFKNSQQLIFLRYWLVEHPKQLCWEPERYGLDNWSGLRDSMYPRTAPTTCFIRLTN